jgi:hypothetical protein
MIAGDKMAVQFLQPGNNFARLWAERGDIAQTDQLIDLFSFNIGKNRIQRNAIAVYIGEESNTQERYLCSMRLDRIYAISIALLTAGLLPKKGFMYNFSS